MSGSEKKLRQKMRRLKAQLMDMFSGKSQTPLDSINLSDSATFYLDRSLLSTEDFYQSRPRAPTDLSAPHALSRNRRSSTQRSTHRPSRLARLDSLDSARLTGRLDSLDSTRSTRGATRDRCDPFWLPCFDGELAGPPEAVRRRTGSLRRLVTLRQAGGPAAWRRPCSGCRTTCCVGRGQRGA